MKRFISVISFMCFLMTICLGSDLAWGRRHDHRDTIGEQGSSDQSGQTADIPAQDPGLRAGAPGAGAPLPGLSPSQLEIFAAGKEEFEEVEGVGDGLGPLFNLDGCTGCHMQPATGGTSPPINPQVAVAQAFGARNEVPSFLKANGPVREVRVKFKPNGERDGSVHSLFVISGRNDPTGSAAACSIAQPDFAALERSGNLSFRIPTPIFGAGLIEQIPDSVILANQESQLNRKAAMGIRGRANHVGPEQGSTNLDSNDGTIARFGWKAQTKSLLLFSGAAYNAEMGITNELFQTERDETPSCLLVLSPNDFTNTDGETALDYISAIEKFAFFMRFLAPPTPSGDSPGGVESIATGRDLFEEVGCSICHTPSLNTGFSTVDALDNKEVKLYSDLLLHRMGPDLADDIIQGQAGPDEFRTAPLWGLGQRIFFLHDGRTTDLLEAIEAHRSGDRRNASEANLVIQNFDRLDEQQKQDMLNFLRSL